MVFIFCTYQILGNTLSLQRMWEEKDVGETEGARPLSCMALKNTVVHQCLFN